MMMKDFRQLAVWDKAHRLVLAVYRATASFPNEERYGLTSQLRRCSTSVPSNIAEGCGRDSDNQFYRFLEIAMGSAREMDYQLLLARDLRYIDDQPYREMHTAVDEVQRMLAALMRSIKPGGRGN